jgi:hypothetical protein
MLGALTASLQSDKQAYYVGETPAYIILGARPGSKVLWTSWKDGKALENQSDHGEGIGPNGTAELAGSPFSVDDIGTWQKQVAIFNEGSGQTDLAQVVFTVSPIPAPTQMPVEAPGFFDQSINLFGMQIPTPLLLGGIVAAFFILKKK